MKNRCPRRPLHLALAGAAASSVVLLLIIGAMYSGCKGREEQLVYGANTRAVAVPEGDGRPVMTDGIFQSGEWDDAATLVINDSVSVRFKQYGDHVFLALDSRRLLSPSIDLYLCADSINVLQLHVSAQLGERWLSLSREKSEDTVWVWGRTSDWYANEFRWIYRLQDSLVNTVGLDYETAIKQSGFPHEGIEIELLKSKVDGFSWYARLEVWSARMREQPLCFPPNAGSESLDGWVRLDLD